MTFRRYELFQKIAPLLSDALVIVNIGFPSQEYYAIKDAPNHFYMLGSMGLASSIGLGLSMTTDKKVVAIDGDGSVLMNLGTFATIGNSAPSNYILLIVDNGAYGSTGDQPTFTSGATSLAAMAKAGGTQKVIEVAGQDIEATLNKCLAEDGPHVIIAKVEPGSQKPTAIPLSPSEIRGRFMREVVG